MQVGSEQFCNEIDILKRGDEDVAKGDDVLVSQVLEQLQLTVGPLGQDGCAEWLHDLLDGNILVGELVSGGANQTKGSHANGLKI